MLKIKHLLIILLTGVSVSFVDFGDTSAYENGSAKVVVSKDANTQTAAIEYENLGSMKASWYGPRFHGRLTANGESYDQMALTAAHKTLPFGTLLKITNTKNGKSTIVRINDRGPYIEGRDLDLSKGTAMALGMIKRGVQNLRVDQLKLPEDFQIYSSLE